MTEPTRTTDETTGREVIIYPSGAKKWADNGQWFDGPTDPNVNPVLRDPVGMQKRGQELIIQRSIQQARDALDSGAIRAGRMDEKLAGSGYGWFVAIEKAAELYFESKSARGAEGLLALIGRATGNLSIRDEGEKVVTEKGITATPAAILELIRAMEAEMQERVERAGAINGEAV